MNKWKIFIEQNGFSNDIVKNSILEGVELDYENSILEINILLSNIVPLIDYIKFTDSLKISFYDKVYKDIIFNIKYESISDFSNNSNDYYLYVIKDLEKVKPSISYLIDYKTRFNYENNTLYIICGKDYNHLQQFLIPIKQEFLKLGINIDVKVEIDEKIESVSERLKKEKKIADEMLNKKLDLLKSELNQSAKNNTTKNKFTKSSRNYEHIEVSKIPKNLTELDLYTSKKGPLFIEISGLASSINLTKLKSTNILSFLLTDENDTLLVKKFLNDDEIINYNFIKEDDSIVAKGKIQMDKYANDIILVADIIECCPKIKEPSRMDNSDEKRIELSVHSKMSNLDGVASASDYVNLASRFNHKAIAITDIDTVASYPEFSKACKKHNIKPIYGTEISLVYEDEFKVVSSKENFDFINQDYVVFDVEATGLSKYYDEIIEIGAVKISKGFEIGSFSYLVKPKQIVSDKILKITNIDKEELYKADDIEVILPKFLDFIKGSVLVAHNAKYDIGMLKESVKRLLNKKMEFPYIDTLTMSQYFFNKDLKRFGLDALCKYFKVKLEGHHRAFNDAKATGECFIKMLNMLPSDIKDAFTLRDYILKNNDGYKYLIPYRVSLLAKNQDGYRSIFKLLSYSLTDYFYKRARIPSVVLDKLRENILVGSGGEFGPVFQAAYYLTDEELEKYIKRFDYIEVSPYECYLHLIDDLDVRGGAIIKDIQRRIIEAAQKLKKIVVATGDVYYLNKDDKIYRDLFIRAPKIGGGIHYLKKYSKRPDCYFRTTSEMLNSFPDLKSEKVYEIVVKNPNKILEKIEDITAFGNTLFSLNDNVFAKNLKIPSVCEEVKRLVKENLEKKYGKVIHPIIRKRIEHEIKIITKNNYAPIYFIAYLLVQKSLKDGYVVGSRGSVGSSFVATILDITEVNPLPPHYFCPNGDFQAFEIKDQLEIDKLSDSEKIINNNLKAAKCGFDLKKCVCPRCGEMLKGDGHDIPFETFLGFDGDKIPDIDLNFSGEYQARAHEYVRELLGSDKTLRAGVIQTVAEKNAFGYVTGYLQENPNISIRRARQDFMAKKIQGVQRSTGQHPGGIVVIPENISVYDITPVQYPADDVKSSWKTTHFDYHSIESNLLKLDILGHDDPTIIRFIMNYVWQNPDKFSFNCVKDIPIDDPRVYDLFKSTKELKLIYNEIFSEVGTYGVPELGTTFVRDMLTQIKPRDFAGLVKVSGLSHGEGIWLGNGDELVRGVNNVKVAFNDIIGCRDDIMTFLINKHNMDPLTSFNIMEFIRKGKPSVDLKKWLEYEKILKENNVPNWYIKSAAKIKYMFPKAHATAYVLMAIRIAWFKINYPLLFYAAFFSKRMDQFDHEIMISGYNAIYNKLSDLKSSKEKNAKEVSLQTTLEVALEMTSRGFNFLRADIYKSDSNDFIIEDEKSLRMPFKSVDMLGSETAKKIVEERKNGLFLNKEDVKKRCSINKTVFETLEKLGALSDVSEEKIIKKDVFKNSLFDF